MRISRAKYLLPVAAAALVLSACGNGSDAAPISSGSSTAASSKATFVLDEWSVMAPAEDLAAGKVAIKATNNGKEAHEIVIVRAADAGSLPTKSDGSVDEAKIPKAKKVGEIADLAAGKTATKTMDLPAGDYVAFCNTIEDMTAGSMDDKTSTTMGSDGMGKDSGMKSGGMHHIHFKLGMVTPFTVS